MSTEKQQQLDDLKATHEVNEETSVETNVALSQLFDALIHATIADDEDTATSIEITLQEKTGESREDIQQEVQDWILDGENLFENQRWDGTPDQPTATAPAKYSLADILRAASGTQMLGSQVMQLRNALEKPHK